MQPHLSRVVGVAEEVEDQLKVIGPLRQQLPYRQAILNLRNDELRENGLDMPSDRVVKLLDDRQNR